MSKKVTIKIKNKYVHFDFVIIMVLCKLVPLIHFSWIYNLLDALDSVPEIYTIFTSKV